MRTPLNGSVIGIAVGLVDSGMLGMHVAAAHEGEWPSDAVPVEFLWLLSRRISRAADAGVPNVLMVPAPTPVS